MDNLRKKIENFNKRWNIVDTVTYEEEFIKFKTRIINIFAGIDRAVSEDGISLFCNIMGIREKWEQSLMGDLYSLNIINTLKNEEHEIKFYRILEIIFCLPIRFDTKNMLYEKTQQALELSNVNLAITSKNEEVILYPKGEKEFDEKLVNQVLGFLNEDSQKHFIEALKFYQTGSPKNAIQSAEELRRALEEFLRYKLKNQQGLDKNISQLLSRLKQDNRDSAIRNIKSQTFSYLDNYINENSKQKDGDIDNIENEFLIYQTGVLLRYMHFSLK